MAEDKKPKVHRSAAEKRHAEDKHKHGHGHSRVKNFKQGSSGE